VVVLVEHDAVDPDGFGELILLDVVVIEPRAFDRIEVGVGEHQRGGAEIAAGLLGVGRHRLLGEIHQVHETCSCCCGYIFVWRMIFSENRFPLFGIMRYPRKPVTSAASSSGFSMSTQ